MSSAINTNRIEYQDTSDIQTGNQAAVSDTDKRVGDAIGNIGGNSSVANEPVSADTPSVTQSIHNLPSEEIAAASRTAVIMREMQTSTSELSTGFETDSINSQQNQNVDPHKGTYNTNASGAHSIAILPYLETASVSSEPETESINKSATNQGTNSPNDSLPYLETASDTDEFEPELIEPTTDQGATPNDSLPYLETASDTDELKQGLIESTTPYKKPDLSPLDNTNAQPIRSSSDRQAVDALALGNLIDTIVTKEQELANTAKKDFSTRYPISIIGGGVSNVCELALDGTSAFLKYVAIADALVGVGLIAGMLDFREGMLMIKTGFEAWKFDRALAGRLLAQGFLQLALGSAMILMSVARIVGITSITAAFAANPYTLSALFFVLSVFLLIEVLHRLGPVVKGTDLGARLKLPELRLILNNKNPVEAMNQATEWVRSKIPECFDNASNKPVSVHTALQNYKAEIGFTAGTEAFRLFEMILKEKGQEEIILQITKVEAEIANWNKTLYLKLLTVILAAIGFTAGMIALARNSNTIDGVQNLVMAVSGGVPAYLDIVHPFEREVPITITTEPPSDTQAKGETDSSDGSGQGSVA